MILFTIIMLSLTALLAKMDAMKLAKSHDYVAVAAGWLVLISLLTFQTV